MIQESDRIYFVNEAGQEVAQVTFPSLGGNVVEIDHTYVDSSLRGQGTADKLLQAVALRLRKEHKKARLSCSYAVKWFEENPEYCDVKAGE